MSNRIKRASAFRAIVFLGLAVAVLISFALGPRIALLLSEYQAAGDKKYCETVLSEGNLFPGAKSVDYATQLNYCEHNPSANWGACGYSATADLADLCREYMSELP